LREVLLWSVVEDMCSAGAWDALPTMIPQERIFGVGGKMNAPRYKEI
jgi:hypothetical protein